MFLKWRNYHHYLVPAHSHDLWKRPRSHQKSLQIPPLSPRPLATTGPLSVSMDFLFWTFCLSGTKCLASFTCIIFSSFLHIVACVSAACFYCRVLFHCMDVLHFVYPLISWWTLGFLLFGHCEQCCTERGCTNIYLSPFPVFNTLGYIVRCGID